MSDTDPTRRQVVVLLAATPALGALASCNLYGRDRGAGGSGEICGTRPDIEGPYYTAGAPTRVALAGADEPGARVTIRGRLIDGADCESPLPGFVLDLWHADDGGEYDNEGYRLRGKVATDDEGRFTIDTILPGRYPSRPQRHIHLKIWHPDGRELLTTQIYFDDDGMKPAGGDGVAVRLVDGVGELNIGVVV